MTTLLCADCGGGVTTPYNGLPFCPTCSAKQIAEQAISDEEIIWIRDRAIRSGNDSLAALCNIAIGNVNEARQKLAALIADIKLNRRRLEDLADAYDATLLPTETVDDKSIK